MKFISLILAMLMTFSALAQVSPEKIQNDTLKLGKSGSTANTNIEFKTSKIRENTTNQKLEISHDGTNFYTAGDVVGPTGTVTDNAVPRYNGTTGLAVQGSSVIVSDTNVMTGLTGITSSGTISFSGIEVNSSNTTVSTNGDDVIIASATSSIYRLTGATLNSIAGFNNTTAGRKIWIINNTGKQIIVKNDSAPTANQGFYTGLGKNIKIKDKGSISAIYNTTMARWVIVGGTGGGGGSSDGGINILENPSFEDGMLGWSNSGGTLSIQLFSNPSEFDESYARFSSTGSGQYFESDAKIVPDFLVGQCLAYSENYKTSGTNWKMQLISGTSTLLAETLLPASSWSETPSLGLPCPAAGTSVKIRFLSGSAGLIEVGKAYLGSDKRMHKLYDDTPIGTVIASLLTEAQFQAQRGTNWVLANGRNVAGTKYASVTGSATIPDLRGVFLRGKDNGRGLGGGEIGLGVYQADEFKSHTHFEKRSVSGGAGGIYVSAVSGNWGNNDGNSHVSTNATGGTETRPKNVTVNYFIKIEGEEVTVVHETGYALRAGQVITGAFSTCPANTLPAEGQSISRAKYPQLFSAIGTTHGDGTTAWTGSVCGATGTCFNLPNYRGRFLRGHSNGATDDPDRASRTANAAGGLTGDNVGSFQGDVYASHSHIYGNKSATGNVLGYPVPNGMLHGDAAWFNWNDPTSTLASGGNETRPRNVYVKYCIQTVNTNITGTFKQIDDLKTEIDARPYVTSTWVSGDSGYRIWSDGYKEQWGVMSGAANGVTAALHVPMSSSNYHVNIVLANDLALYQLVVFGRSTTHFNGKNPGSSVAVSYYWSVNGY